MLSKLLGKKQSKEESKEDAQHELIVQKVSKMNLTDMRNYVKNKVLDFEPTQDGLEEVLKKLILINEDTQKRYIEINDMDSKIKKAFDLVLTILESKTIGVITVELVQNFVEVYDDIITKYDYDHKDIYTTRFKDKMISCAENITLKTELINQMKVVNE